MDTLVLSVPEQHDFNDPTVERDITRLKRWLTDLPLMDVVETVRMVVGALDALNEQKLDFRERFRFLEVYRLTAQRMLSTADPLRIRQLMLSRAQRQETIDGVERLFFSVAGGYKLIVKELYPTASDGHPDPLFGLAINRALEQLNYSLLDSYRFYRTVPPNLIAELHQLYRLARYSGLLRTCVAGKEEADSSASIATLYHAGMLLTLTDPFGLAEGEAGLLFDVLMQHAATCRMIPGDGGPTTTEGMFLIGLDGDEPPVPVTCLNTTATSRAPYVLDATEALAEVRASLTLTPARVRMQSPEAMVLRRLLPEATGRERRLEQRRPEDRRVSLLSGVTEIHDYLLQASGTEADNTGRDNPGLREGLVSCRVLDSSDSGMRLACEKGHAEDARVGDLLGIMNEQAVRQSLNLAIIRSVRVDRDGRMETGVQLMNGGLGPVSCSLPGQTGGEPMDVLFMPANEDERLAATLVAAKGLYEDGRHLLINVGGREVKACAGRLVYDSPVFDRFEFSAE